MSTRLARRVVPLEDLNVQIKYPAHPVGTLFVLRNPLLPYCNAYLPVPSRALLGVWYEFGLFINASFNIWATDSANGQLVAPGYPAIQVFGATGNPKLGARMLAQCVLLADGRYVWSMCGLEPAIVYAVG